MSTTNCGLATSSRTATCTMQASTATAEPPGVAGGHRRRSMHPGPGTVAATAFELPKAPKSACSGLSSSAHRRAPPGLARPQIYQLLENALVPDGAPTINAAINKAAHGGVVLVRAGTREPACDQGRDDLRPRRGDRAAAEAAFVWGGYSVGRTRAGDGC